jgi:hypothetical protein
MIFDRFKPYLWLIKVGAIVAILIAAVWLWNDFVDGQQQIGYDKAAGEYQIKLAKQKETALEAEREWKGKWERAVNERTEAEKQMAVARDAATAADDRLRRTTSDFRQRLSSASAEACRSAAETAAGLLGDCSERYRRVAAAASGHLADLDQCEVACPWSK